MKTPENLCIFLTILAIFLVFMAGCTSKQPEPAPANLPTTAHAIKTTVPSSSTVPVAETTTVSEVAETHIPEKTTENVVTASSVPDDMTLFEDSGVIIRYPNRFSPISESTLDKMRTAAKTQGIDILTILTAGDSKDSIQVTRQTADASIEGIFNEKMAIANEVAVNGSANVIAMTFVRYNVEKQTLADGSGMVRVIAENTEKGTAVTYLLCKPGIIYNINFIYESPERAESQAEVRDVMMGTLQLA